MAPQHDDIVIAGLVTESDRAAHVRTQRAGVTHERALRPRAPGPGEPVEVELRAGPDAPPADAWIELDGERRPMEQTGAEWDTLVWGYVRSYRAVLPGRAAGVVRYSLGVGDVLADGAIRQAYVVGQDGPPAWAAEAVVYQAWVDRFWSGDGTVWPRAGVGPSDHYGGTLAGLRERLDHVETLGSNTLWLNPIYSGSAYHGYEVTDFQAVNPELGSLDDFDRLVAEAHGRGIRIVLDFVPSHVSHLHPTFVAARGDERSPYASWYRFDRWPDDYRTFFGVKTMPQLNHDEPAVRRHLVDAACFWLDRRVDGFRLDYARGASFELWAELRVAARSRSPECWLFGEVVDTPAVQLEYEGLLDGCLDFQLAQTLRGAFGYRDVNGVELSAFLDAHEAAFPPNFSRPSFLDNHDMNRIRWIAGGDSARVRAAALCQFTLAGPPIVYYGTEIGLTQEHGIKDRELGGDDRRARLPMLWGEGEGVDAGTLAFYGDLAALRRERAELREAPRETIASSESSLAYARGPLVVEIDLAAGSAEIREGRETLLRA